MVEIFLKIQFLVENHSLQEKLTKTLRNVQGKGKLSERNMEETLKEIRVALLESDVNYKVVKDFLEKVRQESIGQDVLNSVEPGQLLVKIVHDELINLLGDEDNSLHFAESGLTSIMIVGLQGTGKTTQAAKLAAVLKKLGSVLGILQQEPSVFLKAGRKAGDDGETAKIEALIEERRNAKKNKDWAKADAVRNELQSMGIIIEDGPNGTTWRRK